ncbi:MAG: helix-turn-helix domain-containing protein [Hyphomicrobium sp.]|uniref:helix-turn-helix domain-containing protein n=1 Tax=Hyphomicrobium sp. TaxID=82 RepID=UPI0035652E59
MEKEDRIIYMTKFCEKIFFQSGIKLDMDLLKSKSRIEDAVIKRAVAVYILQKQRYTSIAIGELLNKDHATILHSAKVFNSNKKKLSKYQADRNRDYNYLIKRVDGVFNDISKEFPIARKYSWKEVSFAYLLGLSNGQISESEFNEEAIVRKKDLHDLQKRLEKTIL